MFATRDVFALLLSLFAVFYATSLSGVVSFHPAFVVNPSGGGGDGARFWTIVEKPLVL